MWLTVFSGLLLFLNILLFDDFILWLGSFLSFGRLLRLGLFVDFWLVNLGILGFFGLLFRSFLLFGFVAAGRFLCLSKS